MQILLVYEMVPDRTQVYNLCVSQEDSDKILKCHGCYGNLVDLPEDVEPLVCDWLPKFLENFTPIFDSNKVFALKKDRDWRLNQLNAYGYGGYHDMYDFVKSLKERIEIPDPVPENPKNKKNKAKKQ